MIKRHRFLGAVIALTAVVAACGGDDDADSGTTEAPGGDSTEAPGATAAPGDTTSDSEAQDDGTTDGASITIALGSEPTSLDPHVVDDGGERPINDNIYETLLTRTPKASSNQAWPPSCRRRSTTRRGSSSSATA